MPPPTQEAAPSIVVEETSGAAGSKKSAGSDSRKYNYFDPKGRKATLYEDVTVDVQPDPARYLIQDWILSFADGTPTYGPTRTRIKSSDWHKYRAPDQEWDFNNPVGNCVANNLGYIVEIKFSHEVELVGFNRFRTEIKL